MDTYGNLLYIHVRIRHKCFEDLFGVVKDGIRYN